MLFRPSECAILIQTDTTKIFFYQESREKPNLKNRERFQLVKSIEICFIYNTWNVAE